MDDLGIKTRVAILSVVSNSFLILLKVIAGILSGSVSIISEAIHSGMDLVAALIAFFSVKISAKPADKDHPYGHGKVENVSGVIEGLLILVAAVIIIWEAIKKIIRPTHIGETNIALLVMFISATVNFFVSRKLYRVAKQVDSVALEADALHLKTDVYTSLGVGIGMLLIKFTGISILDPIVAILVALLILKESISLIWNAYCPLLDTKLSDGDEEKIKSVINRYKNEIIDFHELRTRKSGSIKYIDFHMTVNKDISVEQSHKLSDSIESDLEEVLKNTNVSIHIEPGI
ncbi:MAG TPA: cation diffusion facilitator family transporter [Pseudobacteroides sp.]|uniref:cation diffusion facilitator family transporter n=1 Tax=Pseudobacteroides sp. TaxID=1968840 RepID=UPI002F93F123